MLLATVILYLEINSFKMRQFIRILYIQIVFQFIALNNTKNANARNYCQDQSKKHFRIDKSNENMSYFTNFNSFSDLILCSNQTYNTTQSVKFFPHRPLLIDKTFNFSRIIDEAHLSGIHAMYLINTHGLDLNSRAFFKRAITDLILIYLCLSLMST